MCGVCRFVCLDDGAGSVVHSLTYLLFYLVVQVVCVHKLTPTGFSQFYHTRHPPHERQKVVLETGRGAKHTGTHRDWLDRRYCQHLHVHHILSCVHIQMTHTRDKTCTDRLVHTVSPSVAFSLTPTATHSATHTQK